MQMTMTPFDILFFCKKKLCSSRLDIKPVIVWIILMAYHHRYHISHPSVITHEERKKMMDLHSRSYYAYYYDLLILNWKQVYSLCYYCLYSACVMQQKVPENEEPQ